MPYPEQLATHFLGVGGVIIQNGKVLLVKLTYGGGQGYWLIPGGLVEKGETLEDGLIREIREETGLDIVPTGILGIRSMVRQSDLLTDVYSVFQCELSDPTQQVVKQDDEIAEVKWFDLKAIDEADVLEYTKIIISKYLKSNPMIRDTSFDDQAKKRIKVSKYEQYWII